MPCQGHRHKQNEHVGCYPGGGSNNQGNPRFVTLFPWPPTGVHRQTNEGICEGETDPPQEEECAIDINDDPEIAGSEHSIV